MENVDSILLDGRVVSKCEVSSVIPRVMEGQFVIIRNGLQSLSLFDSLQSHMLGSIDSICGSVVSSAVSRDGLENLHRHVSLDDIEPVYKHARVELANKMPAVTASLYRLLGVEGDFYVHDASLVRLMMPFDVMKSKQKEFRGHIGKLSLHGPHHDHYQNVPVNSINSWIALGEVKAENGMLMYPEIWGQNLPEGSGEVRGDQYLGKPVRIELDKGDILLFHSNHMHASHINTTDETRVVLTNRVCIEKPLYPDPLEPQKYFYSSAFPKKLDLAEVFKVDGFVGDKKHYLKQSLLEKACAKVGLGLGKNLPVETENKKVVRKVADFSELDEGELAIVDEKTCATRIDGQVSLFARKCPHQGADLSLGEVKDGRIICPFHGLPICLKSGQSSCKSIAPLGVELLAADC